MTIKKQIKTRWSASLWLLAAAGLAIAQRVGDAPSRRVADVEPDAVSDVRFVMADYGVRRKLAIDAARVDAPLTHFPVLVRLTTNHFDFTTARADGFDIRFTAADGVRLLAYERERHDAIAEAAEYWVRLPLVTSDVDTVFYMYYGNPAAADGANPTNVWDEHFAGVWHMDDDTVSAFSDSTANSNQAFKLASNEPVEADGLIGMAQQFDGINDYARLPEPPAPSTSINTGSVFAWIRTSNAGANYRGIVVKQMAFGMFLNNNIFGVYDWGNSQWRASGLNLANDEWHFVGFTFENINAASPASNARLFVNGDYVITVTVRLSNHNEGVVFGAGNNPATTQYFRGLIDEARISSHILSDAWIKADYHSGRGTLLSVGAAEEL